MRWIASASFAIVGFGAAVAVFDDAPEAQQRNSTVTVLQPPPFTPGLRFAEPPVIRSRGGRLRIGVVARNGSVKVSGVAVGAAQSHVVELPGGGTVGPTFPGPTLHVSPGDVVEIAFDNQLTVPAGVPAPNCAHDAHGAGAQATNLHFHGLHVTPRGRSPYGDDVLLSVGHGKVRYRFRIPRDHDQGTFWYHAHHHHCTDDQVFRGLAGLLLIGDSRRYLPPPLRTIRTRSLALKDIQVQPSKGTPAWAIPADHDWANGTHRTVNGLVNPSLSIRPGETQLWRVANVSSAVWYRVALVDPANGNARDEFTVVARDGNQSARPQTGREVVVPPGARRDLLVTAPPSGGRILQTLPFDQGRLVFPQDVLATVSVAGAPATPLGGPAPRGLERFPSRRGPTRFFTFSNNKDFSAFLINGKTFDPKRVDAAPRLNTTETWVLQNVSTEMHPFHVHQNDFRVLSVNGRTVARPPGDQDVVALPARDSTGRPGSVVIEMPFTRFRGKFVFHCHILDHEDSGMMALVEVR